MRSQKGITLTSLATYVVLIFVVLAILATVTANFQSSIKEINQEGIEIAEINKFNSYFLQEVKKQGNEITKITENSIEFSSNNKYEFDSENRNINLIELDNDGNYSKIIEVAENIEECNFSKRTENGKVIIGVEIRAKNSQKLTNEYVLNTDKLTSEYEDENDYVYYSNTVNVQENNI